MRTVYTGGTFDLFHAGHVNFLRQCSKIAGESGEVVVGLNDDSFVQRFKGKVPVYTYMERFALVRGCRYVDRVVLNYGDADSTKVILDQTPDFIVVGSDWACKDYYTQMGFTQDWLDSQGIILIYIPYTEGISTTIVKNRVLGPF